MPQNFRSFNKVSPINKYTPTNFIISEYLYYTNKMSLLFIIYYQTLLHWKSVTKKKINFG